MFFEHVLRENRPLSEFLTADYTFLNERLAAHYGIPGVTGPEMRRVQLQTDPARMPVENASVIWPEKLSPHRRVATLRIPLQEFDSPAQMAFDRVLSFNPWHCLAAHRPLGNQGRARRQIYLELSKFRQRMNGDPRVEPTGAEVFGAASGVTVAEVEREAPAAQRIVVPPPAAG